MLALAKKVLRSSMVSNLNVAFYGNVLTWVMFLQNFQQHFRLIQLNSQLQQRVILLITGL